MSTPHHPAALFLCAGLSFAHAAPPAGSQWIPIPEFTDEFGGEALDAAKWHDHNPTWRGRKPGLFAKTNVTVRGGRLHLHAMVEDVPNAPSDYHTFTTAAVKSKALVKYGYFEIKCRPMKSKASSAFWFYHDTASEWTEIDVFEICGAGDEWKGKYHMNAHVFRSPTVKKHLANPGGWQAPFDFTAEDHIYALEWNAKVIRWYVDGVMVRELDNKHWHQELAMNFDSETMPEWFGLPEKDTLPSIFSIDYVRSWRAAGDAASAPANSPALSPAAGEAGPLPQPAARWTFDAEFGFNEPDAAGLGPDALLVRDHINRPLSRRVPGQHDYRWQMVLPPDLKKVVIGDGQAILTDETTGNQLLVRIFSKSPVKGICGPVAGEFGKLNVLAFETRCVSPEFTAILIPLKAGEEAPETSLREGIISVGMQSLTVEPTKTGRRKMALGPDI